MYKYIYPKLTEHIDFGIFRIGGPGLANCIMTSMRAYVVSVNENLKFITPTWNKISMGPLIRGEKDKRHYIGLFDALGIQGIRKIFLILFSRKILFIEGMDNYFADLKNNYPIARDYFYTIVKKTVSEKIKKQSFENVVGVHIRMGDYKGTTYETSIEFYRNVILEIKSLRPEYVFFVYSDAENNELKDIVSIEGVERKFFGDALSDIVALSRSKLIIASDSTFSAIAAFVEQVPIVFPRRHFNSPLLDESNEFVSDQVTRNSENLQSFLNRVI